MLGTSGGEGGSRASCQRSLVCGSGPSDGGSGWAGLFAMQPTAFALRLHKVHEGSAPHCLSVSAPTRPSDVGLYGSALVCEQPVLGCRRPQSYAHDVRRQHHSLSFRGRPLPEFCRGLCTTGRVMGMERLESFCAWHSCQLANWGPKMFVPSSCQYSLSQQLLMQHLLPVPGRRFGGFTWEENRQNPHPYEACSLFNVGRDTHESKRNAELQQ